MNGDKCISRAFWTLMRLILPVLCMTAVLLPLRATALADDVEEESDPYYFYTSVDELRQIINDHAGEQIWAIDNENLDYRISEDLTIPNDCFVFFGEGMVTVGPEVTVTVEGRGSLFYTNMLVQGTVFNRGMFSQMGLQEGKYGQMRIEGRFVNEGWFSYGNVQGLEKIENSDTGTIFNDLEESNTEPEPVPEQEEKNGESNPAEKRKAGFDPAAGLDRLRFQLRRIQFRLRSFFSRNREVLRRAIPTILILLAAIASAGIGRRRKKQETGRETARNDRVQRPTSPWGSVRRQEASFRTEKEPMFSDDLEKRMKHLDDWLKSGLIDKNEYKVLKERYLRQR